MYYSFLIEQRNKNNNMKSNIIYIKAIYNNSNDIDMIRT